MAELRDLYTQVFRDQTEESGRQAGYGNNHIQPFPEGSLFKVNWDRGYKRGKQERLKEMVRRARVEA